MPYRVQVEAERWDGTLEFLGEFLTDNESLHGDEYPDISAGVAQVLKKCFPRVTSTDKIIFWQEWISQETFEEESKAEEETGE